LFCRFHRFFHEKTDPNKKTDIISLYLSSIFSYQSNPLCLACYTAGKKINNPAPTPISTSSSGVTLSSEQASIFERRANEAEALIAKLTAKVEKVCAL
jgi:hypothetical protein